MGLAKLTAGDGYTYLTRQVAAHDSTEKGRGSLEEYYSERGESPGQWRGTGLAELGIRPGERVTEAQMKSLFGLGRHPNAAALEAAVAASGGSKADAVSAGALGRRFNVYEASSNFNVQVAQALTAYNIDRGLKWDAQIPVDERARIRSQIATDVFTEQHGRAPTGDRELDGFVKRASRQATSAVAGYDLTFSPVKSVSALWALAPQEVAEVVRAAHDAAVEDAIGWLEHEVAFTREGRGGARQVAVRGLIATAFTHRDTRAGDPDLHTHLAVSNKVQTTDGRWLALDGRVLYQAVVATSERYNTRLEAELVDRLGVQFGDVPRAGGKRPVREIAGISPLLNRWWSRRRRMIESRQSELAVAFQARHGRPPTPAEAYTLGQQAWRETRDAKHAPLSEAEQRAAWRAEAAEVLGDQHEVDAMIDRGLTRGGLTHRGRTRRPDKTWHTETATATVAAVEADRATWKVWHLRAEAERRARAAGIGLIHLDEAVDRLVEDALALCVRLGCPDPIVEPETLRRSDGVSVYDVHGATRYTSTRVLAAERELLQAARSTGGRTLSPVRVSIALANSAAAGFELNDAQAAMVRELATSGARLQLALAPAGTGKTTAMRVLASAWANSGGDVLGLAPSAQAAHELRGAIRGTTDTLAKLTWTLTHTTPEEWPGWVSRIGSGSLVIIDEAGQAATPELAAAVRFVTGRGGIVRLIGDNQQLAAVGAGGVLRDLQEIVGAVTLSEVRRFHDHAEAAVTLAVRDGDPAALGFYADNDRIHVGDLGAVTTQAYDAWAADRSAGLDSILLAPTRDLVTRLNARARADRTDRTAADTESGRGPDVVLADGNRAGVGDVIVTRRNERRLILTQTDWVKNGDRWTVTAVHPDRSIAVRHHGLGRVLRLPADYVAEHVQLGYATTVHGAQGMTTDTSHTVVIGDEPRQLLYVALSRGRSANHLYLANGYDGDPHELIRPESLLPPTAIDVLTAILERDGSQHSATTTQRALDAATTQLHDAALRYHDALGCAAEQTLGSGRLGALDREIEILWPGLTGEPSYPTLRGHLALLALDGVDPLTVLVDAAQPRELDSSGDRAAVLDWRLPSRTTGPLPWLQPEPAPLAADPQWGPYLGARAERVSALADLVRMEAAGWTPAGAPPWAADLTSETHAALRADLAVWRAAYAVPDTEPRPTGPAQLGADAAAHQHQLDRRVRAASGVPPSTTGGWREQLPEDVCADRGHRRLARHLQALGNAGIAVDDLLDQALAAPRPLPDEHAADALWWRVVRHLGPAALRATDASAVSLRPSWVPALVEFLGEQTAERVMADSAWPALVAAVHARPAEWSPEQLLAAVTDPRESTLAVEDLCAALVWRVATMTDPPQEPEDVEQDFPEDAPAAVIAENRFDVPAPGMVRDRVIELNHQALGHYRELYEKSWAPVYLRERLGADLSEDPGFRVGYAPPGPASLIQRLCGDGANIEELIEAGLARRTHRGRFVDAFRDRLVFPIYSGDDLVGFIGRRNPGAGDHGTGDLGYAGPKYLNTRTTPVFTKGEQLFGLTEAAPLLAAGATPVLVEGPLDAIAVTLAGQGRHVGIAPLGTAFTASQVELLRPYFRDDPGRIVIATDPDPAGWTAAQNAFWRLAGLRADPRHLAMPDGIDPADLVRTEGLEALTARLNAASSFGSALADHLLDTGDTRDRAARIWLGRDLAQVIGALPPEQWPDLTTRVNERLDLPAGMLDLETFEAGRAWTDDPEAASKRALAVLTRRAQALAHRPDPPAPAAESTWTPMTPAAASPAVATRRSPGLELGR